MEDITSKSLEDRLLDKSVEAFILGLEIYNKPTIEYRIEGFSFFICNAWELMLKAKLIKDRTSIYYPDTPNRTLSLSDVVKKVYTDKRQPLRINLENVLDLRNTSTHFITNDYESVYAPFFQANVLNFIEQTQRFHGRDVTKRISQNFLTLSVSQNELTNEEIIGKYPPEMASKLIDKKEGLQKLQKEHSSNDLFIPIKHEFIITKDKHSANFSVAVNKNSDIDIRVVKELIDPNNRFKLSFNNVIKAINKQVQTKNIPFSYVNSEGSNEFTTYTLSLFNQFYDLKNDEKYCYEFGGTYRYSQQTVEFIVEAIQKDPNVIDNIKEALANGSKKR